MAKNIEWTEDFERRLRAKLEDEYGQCDNLVAFASRCNNMVKKGVINVEESADTLLTWIKKELKV